ncbi:MAG: hypothetical protein PWP62_2812 [Eubacteriaceae bacterium]|nr:hypothetical protein [Eubacteriaceae bacterium]
MNSETVRAKTQVWYASGYGCSQEIFKRADVKKELDKRMMIGEYQKSAIELFIMSQKSEK